MFRALLHCITETWPRLERVSWQKLLELVQAFSPDNKEGACELGAAKAVVQRVVVGAFLVTAEGGQQ